MVLAILFLLIAILSVFGGIVSVKGKISLLLALVAWLLSYLDFFNCNIVRDYFSRHRRTSRIRTYKTEAHFRPIR